MKVAVIGGGSTYTPELVNGFLARLESFPLKELWLMDVDPARLEIVGGFAGRMVRAKGEPFRVVLTTDQRQAVSDAAYVNTQHRKLAAQESWPPSRAEEVMEVETDLLHAYTKENLSEPPPDLMKRGGAYYSTVATQLLNAHYGDMGETHVVNVANNGAVSEWPADWVLELPAKVNRSGIHPLPAEPLPPACFGLLAQVKAYELLTVEAAVHGDIEAAYQALLVHPLGPTADWVLAVLDDLLKTNRR